METREARVPFRADWHSLLSVSAMPEKLFPTFPYEARVDGGEKPLVKLSFRRFLTRFSFEGSLDFTFNEPHVTYILKGLGGLLILSFAAGDSELLARASADIPGERGLGKKLDFIAKGSALAVARMAESHGITLGKALGSPEDFVIGGLEPSLLPHIVRYVRLHTGERSFLLEGKGGRDRFTITVVDDLVERMEHDSGSGLSITEIEKGILDVDEVDFEGAELQGRYRIRVLRS
ncbi:hypothetical protein [Thermococcus sp.]|uniref:hypothetical protein n=1 Tax=Thermococcus sp. TaxID=35749 RepID=UPI00263989C4|nr:hypothetical protein [Thermococcus sp.]